MCVTYLFVGYSGDDNLDDGGQVSQPLGVRSGDDQRIVGQIQKAESDQTAKQVPADVA